MRNFAEYFEELRYTLAKLHTPSMETAYQRAAISDHLYIFGNGGSAAIANHWVCDFMKGVNEDTDRKVKATSLSSNIPLITAIANDLGYDQIFSKQLEYLQPTRDDVVIAISASGNSKNIIRALEKANELGVHTIALTGFYGGIASAIANTNVHVPVYNYGIVEDIHMMILHAISQRIRSKYAIDPSSLKL